MGAGVNKMIGDPCIFVRLIFVIKFICYFCIVFVKANRNEKELDLGIIPFVNRWYGIV